MSAIVLHSYRRCPFAIRVRMVLEEKGIEYQVIEEDLSNLSKELLAHHPEGRVPLLIHKMETGNQILYQSTVITEYLEDTFPSPTLMPSEPHLKAKVRLWTYWCDQIFKPDLDQYKYDFKKLSPKDQSELIRRLESNLDQWNSALKKDQFMVGPKITLADIHLFPFARQFFAIKPPYAGIEKFEFLLNWLERLVSRPSFERVMKK